MFDSRNCLVFIGLRVSPPVSIRTSIRLNMIYKICESEEKQVILDIVIIA